MLATGPAQRVSIYLNEDTRWRDVPLHKAILAYLVHKGIRSVTARSGFAGFGAHRVIHTSQIELLSDHLPIQVEFLESRGRLGEVLPTLQEMVTDGLITVQDVEILKSVRQKNSGALSALPTWKSGKVLQLRVYVGESDGWQGRPLYDAIVRQLSALGMSGATVCRGILGYGAKESTLPEGSVPKCDSPMVVSVVDTEDKISLGAKAIEEMVEDAIIVVSDVDYTRLIQGQHQGATNHAKLPSG